MPKGKKRTAEDYEREIEEAAKRMQKEPEHLKAARHNRSWLIFLDSIGVNPNSTRTEKGQGFWEDVRNKVQEKELGITYRQVAEHGADIETGIFRDAKGRFTKEAEGNIPVVLFRNMETGRFVSRKSLEN